MIVAQLMYLYTGTTHTHILGNIWWDYSNPGLITTAFDIENTFLNRQIS